MPDYRDYRVLVTGSRNWTDTTTIVSHLDALRRAHGLALVLIHGACRTGADAIATTWARQHGVHVELHPADWTLGAKAGPIRNQAMVDAGADECVAFIRNKSKGATHCANAAKKAGIPTTITRTHYGC